MTNFFLFLGQDSGKNISVLLAVFVGTFFFIHGYCKQWGKGPLFDAEETIVAIVTTVFICFIQSDLIVGLFQKIRHRFFGSFFLLSVLYIFCKLSKDSIVLNAQKISIILMLSEITGFLAAKLF